MDINLAQIPYDSDGMKQNNFYILQTFPIVDRVFHILEVNEDGAIILKLISTNDLGNYVYSSIPWSNVKYNNPVHLKVLPALVRTLQFSTAFSVQ